MSEASEIAAAAAAMKAHPNWNRPARIVTYAEIEADRREHELCEAIDYFRANDPARLAELLKE